MTAADIAKLRGHERLHSCLQHAALVPALQTPELPLKNSDLSQHKLRCKHFMRGLAPDTVSAIFNALSGITDNFGV